MLILLSGCSGSGKNTIINLLLERNPNLKYLQSCTSRAKEQRDDQTHAYIHLSKEEFEEKIKGIVEGTLPSLVEEGYKVAKERDIKNIGKQLKEIYEKVLNEETIKN